MKVETRPEGEDEGRTSRMPMGYENAGTRKTGRAADGRNSGSTQAHALEQASDVTSSHYRAASGSGRNGGATREAMAEYRTSRRVDIIVCSSPVGARGQGRLI